MKESIPTYVDNNYLDTIRFEKLELVSAIAELIDNAIGSYFRNKEFLSNQLRISIRWNNEEFIIEDNAGGISIEGFKTALLVSPKIERVDIAGDVGQYGLGMKKSALWIGNLIEFTSGSIKDNKTYKVFWPKRENNEIQRETDLETIDVPEFQHGLLIRISDLNEWNTNNFINSNKIKTTLTSIFRKYILEDNVYISINSEKLIPSERQILSDRHVSAYNKTDSDDKRKHCLQKYTEPIIEWKLPVYHQLNNYTIKGWLGIQKSSEIATTGIYVYFKKRGVLGFSELRYNPYSTDLSSFVYKRLIGEIEIFGFEKPPMGNDMPEKQQLDDVFESFKGALRTGKIEIDYPLNSFFHQLNEHRKTMIDAEPCIKRIIGSPIQSPGIIVKPNGGIKPSPQDHPTSRHSDPHIFTIDNNVYHITLYHSQTVKINIETVNNEVNVDLYHNKKINEESLYLISFLLHYHTQTEDIFSWGNQYIQSILEHLP